MKKIYLLALACIGLTACEQSVTEPDLSNVPLSIRATIGEAASRAVNATWEANDEIGITGAIGDFNNPVKLQYCNLKYTHQGSGNFTGTDIWFYRQMTLAAYYPHTGDEGTEPEIFKISTTADRQTSAEQRKIDFLYARQTEIHAIAPAATVDLNFEHKMTKITFTFVKGTDEIRFDKAVNYQIEGLKMQGSFNPYTGECGTDPDAPAETLVINLNGITSGEALSSLILFPQTPQGDVNVRLHLAEIEGASEQVYSTTLNLAAGLKAGCHYNYKIKVTKTGLILGDITILDWATGKNATAFATIDGGGELPEGD